MLKVNLERIRMKRPLTFSCEAPWMALEFVGAWYREVRRHPLHPVKSSLLDDASFLIRVKLCRGVLHDITVKNGVISGPSI